jgi:hypothetical protein
MHWKCNTFSRCGPASSSRPRDADKAKQTVIFDESGHTWDNAAEDYDSALRTTIGGCRRISDEEIEQLGDNPAQEQLHNFIHGTNTSEESPQE